jgi:hypothetical protein
MAAQNERLYAAAGPGHWNDPDMMIAGMSGLSETQNRSFFSLWCMMAAPLMAGNDLRKMTEPTIRILTNMEAIGINQDPLGIQGRIVRRSGSAEIWAGKPLFDGSRALLVFNPGTVPAEVKLTWSDIGLADSAALYVRDVWTHKTTGPHGGGLAVEVAPNDVAFLRVSKTDAFPIPPIIVADNYRIALSADLVVREAEPVAADNQVVAGPAARTARSSKTTWSTRLSGTTWSSQTSQTSQTLRRSLIGARYRPTEWKSPTALKAQASRPSFSSMGGPATAATGMPRSKRSRPGTKSWRSTSPGMAAQGKTARHGRSRPSGRTSPPFWTRKGSGGPSSSVIRWAARRSSKAPASGLTPSWPSSAWTRSKTWVGRSMTNPKWTPT